MFTLIKNASLYTPEFAGKKDVLIAFDRVAAIGDSLELNFVDKVEVIDAEGKLLIPGFVDQHVHITGGGGEGGFSTRTKEITIHDLVENGITTVVGLLGTDGVTRSLEVLYAKAKTLEMQGITCFMHTGSYQVPVNTITGSIQRDLVLIDKVIGVGEIALSDHRSFYPTDEELSRIAAEARVGGMLGGKAGIVHTHMGDADEAFGKLFRILKDKPIPISTFVPTHVNRTAKLLEQGFEFARMGGFIDLTAGFDDDDQSIPAYEAMRKALDSGVSEDRISMSSDGNGSTPIFNEKGELTGIAAASCRILFGDMKRAVFEHNVPLDKALKIITSNPARMLKLDRDKGSIAEGKHADMVITDKDLNIETVFAKGRKIVENGQYKAPEGILR